MPGHAVAVHGDVVRGAGGTSRLRGSRVRVARAQRAREDLPARAGRAVVDEREQRVNPNVRLKVGAALCSPSARRRRSRPGRP